MDDLCDALDRWPIVTRLMDRLIALKKDFPPLRDVSRRCLRGAPGSDTLFLVYERDLTESPTLEPGEEREAIRPRRTQAMTAASPASLDDAPAIRRSFGEHGLLLQMRFDRGAARRAFPILSVCDFGDAQISLMSLEGPPTPQFRQLENAVWGILYDEAKRFDLERDRG